jgi:hypothetical protein
MTRDDCPACHGFDEPCTACTHLGGLSANVSSGERTACDPPLRTTPDTPASSREEERRV